MGFSDHNFKSAIKTTEGLLSEKIPQHVITPQTFLEGFGELQKEYITHPNRYLDIEGGKRGGKSVSIAGRCVFTDLFIMPEKFGYIIYGATTAEQAQRLGAKRLLRAMKDFKLNWKDKLSKNQIQTFHDDSELKNEIIFLGLKDMRSAEKYQGLPIKACFIDEAPLVNTHILEFFCRDVVAFGMRDFGNSGSLTLIGNPAPIEVGYRWNYQKRPTTKRFTMNILDNPSFDINETNKFINEELQHRGETREYMSNASKRLILGKKATDKHLAVLQFKPTDIFSNLPNPLMSYFRCCGIDHGFNDKTAMVVLCYDQITNEVFLEYEYQEAGLTTTPIAEKLKNEILPNFQTSPHNIYDTGGAGKTTAETLQQEHGIPIQAAKKKEKLAWIKRLRDYNSRGLLKIRKTSALLAEADLTIFLKDFSALDEKAFHSDIFHAVLYAFRFIYNFHITQKPQQNKKILSPKEALIQKLQNEEKQLNHNKIDEQEYIIS